MSDLHTWDTTAANNNSTPPDGWPENMSYANVNNAAREMMAAIKKQWNDYGGVNTTAGSADAYTLTPSATYTAYKAGMTFLIEASFTNTGAATLNVNSLGAKGWKDESGSDFAAGDIVSGNMYLVVYDNGSGYFRTIGGTTHTPAALIVASAYVRFVPDATPTITADSGVASVAYSTTGVFVLTLDSALSDDTTAFGLATVNHTTSTAGWMVSVDLTAGNADEVSVYVVDENGINQNTLDEITVLIWE